MATGGRVLGRRHCARVPLMDIVTWNVNSLRARMPRVLE